MMIDTLKTLLPTMLAIGLCVAMTNDANAIEPSQVNPKALQDLQAYLVKTEAADKLFGAKKYAESATTFAAANALFVRSMKRDGGAGQLTISFPLSDYPSLRYYGYGAGNQMHFQEDATGKWSAPAYGFNSAINQMWQDASILGGAARGPLGGTSDDEPTMVDLDQNQIDSMIRHIYGPVSKFDLPVQDDQWRGVLLQSRRAKLILEYAIEKFPAWKTEKLQWSNNSKNYYVTGVEALADAVAKIKEAEPEYAKLVSDFKAASPRYFDDTKARDLEDLNAVLAGIKRDGYMKGQWFTDLIISKDHLSGRRKIYKEMWAAEGKAMPASAIAPLEAKMKAVYAAIEAGAPKWSFPAGKTHNAAIEAQAKNAIKSLFPGAVILKTALATSGWEIVKDTAQMPMYRQRAVMVLFKKPGQKWAYLIYGGYAQEYSGGGTYNSSGKISYPYLQARVQKSS